MNKDHIWQRRTFWVTLIGVVGTIGVTLWVSGGPAGIAYYFQSSTSASETESKQNDDNGRGSVSIQGVYVSPVNLDISSYFFMELNSSSVNRPVNFDVSIDFGNSTASVCDTTPSSVVETIDSEDNSFIRFRISRIEQSQSVYIACLLDLPYFSRILVHGDSLISDVTLDFDQYMESLNSEPAGFWTFTLRTVVYLLIGLVFIRLARLVFD